MANELQLLEKRLDTFFDAEGVQCVMLQDYLKALSVHTEKEKYFMPRHESKKKEIGVLADNEDFTTRHSKKARINPRTKSCMLFASNAPMTRFLEDN